MIQKSLRIGLTRVPIPPGKYLPYFQRTIHYRYSGWKSGEVKGHADMWFPFPSPLALYSYPDP